MYHRITVFKSCCNIVFVFNIIIFIIRIDNPFVTDDIFNFFKQ